MFCENCGKQIPDGSAFCENCGARIAVEAAPAAPVEAAAPVAVAPAKKLTFAGLVEKAKTIHQKNKLIFPIAGAVLVVAIVLIVVFSILGKQVSMKDYLEITMEGYDGYGQMSYDFGDVSFGLRAAGDKDSKGFGDGDDDEYFLGYDRSDVPKDCRDNLKQAQKLVASIEISYELPEGKTSDALSNGDVITFTIECDEALAEDLGLTIQDTTFEYTVEGLKPIAKFDVLSYFDLKAEGYDGYGSVELVCSKTASEKVGDITFEMEAGENRIRWTDADGYSSSIWPYLDGDVGEVFNGDTVKGKVDVSADILVSEGVELIGLEKEYTVSNLKETTKVDLLQYYKVEFTGLNDSGRATVTPTQDTLTVGEYEIDLTTGRWTKDGESITRTSVWVNDDWGLSNGDKIVLKTDSSNYTLRENGIKITVTEKEITVSNLASYITELSQIKDPSAFEAAGKQVVTDYLNDDWADAVHDSWFGRYSNQTIGDDLKLHKMVLTMPKSSSSYTKNTLWMIFSVTISDNEITTPTVYYFAVSQSDVAVYGDGSVCFDDYFSKHSGMTSYDAVYAELIDSYNLNIEVSE